MLSPPLAKVIPATAKALIARAVDDEASLDGQEGAQRNRPPRGAVAVDVAGQLDGRLGGAGEAGPLPGQGGTQVGRVQDGAGTGGDGDGSGGGGG